MTSSVATGVRIVLFLAMAGTARGIDLADGPASVQIRATEHRGHMQMRFADELTVVLKVTGTQVEVDIDPRRLVLGADWRVEADAPTPLKGGWEQAFRFAPLKPGNLEIALAPWKYRIDGGAWQRTRWRPATVEVVSHADPASLTQPRDITAIETLPPVSAAPLLWPWLVAAALVVVIAFAVWRWRRRRPSAVAKALSPASAALRHLDRLARRGLLESGQTVRFFTLVSLILRRYLTRRYEVGARRQTTSELEASLANHPLLQKDASYLSGLCRQCDTIRFARQPIAAADAARKLQELRDWIALRK